MRARRLATALAAAVAVLPLPAGAAARTVPCDRIHVSPTVTKDKTLFCVAFRNGILVSSSTDLGRTWRTATPTGWVDREEFVFNELVLSPSYAQDGLLFLQTKEALYASLDRAVTLLPIDPAGGAYTVLPSLTALRRVLPVAPVPAPNGVLLAQAFQTAPPHLVHPPARTVAPGGPGLIETFLAAPPTGDGPYAGTILAVGRDVPTLLTGGVPPRIQDAVYACTAALACPTRRVTFPHGQVVDDIGLSPDFGRTGVVHAVTWHMDFHPRLWISRDGGATFAPLASAQRIVDTAFRIGGYATARVVSDPGRPRRLYLRVGGRDSRESPSEQLFRSDDDGRTWARLGYWRPEGSRYGSGVAGWPGPSFAVGRDTEPMAVLADGRVLLVGGDRGGARLYCSTDGAKTWQAACRR